jgi:hypothetical protein
MRSFMMHISACYYYAVQIREDEMGSMHGRDEIA